MLSFVYDVADLYKTEVSIPVAFRAAAEDKDDLERRVRTTCRDQFVATRILERIIPDIQKALMVQKRGVGNYSVLFDQDAAAPGSLWDPMAGELEGGRIHPLEVEDTEAEDGGNDT